MPFSAYKNCPSLFNDSDGVTNQVSEYSCGIAVIYRITVPVLVAFHFEFILKVPVMVDPLSVPSYFCFATVLVNVNFRVKGSNAKSSNGSHLRRELKNILPCNTEPTYRISIFPAEPFATTSQSPKIIPADDSLTALALSLIHISESTRRTPI